MLGGKHRAFTSRRSIRLIIVAAGLVHPPEAITALMNKINEFEDLVEAAGGTSATADGTYDDTLCQGRTPFTVYRWDITKSGTDYTCVFVDTRTGPA